MSANRLRDSRSRCALLMVVATACSACAVVTAPSSPPRYPVPDGVRLTARIERLYSAEMANDWETFYAMFSPEVRANSTFQQFMRDSDRRDTKLVFWRIRQIRGAVADPEARGVIGAAEVPMDVTTGS